jgi:hypothetical protein
VDKTMSFKHIVMWTLHENANGNDKSTNARLAKEALEALNGQIPGLQHLEVGIDIVQAVGSYDLVLVAELESRASLDVYQDHPKHQAVLPLIKSIASQRAAVDY